MAPIFLAIRVVASIMCVVASADSYRRILRGRGMLAATCGNRLTFYRPRTALHAELSRALVRDAIVGVCTFRSWYLYALHVRTNHIHGIVETEALPSRVLNDWKAYATRSLRAAGVIPPDRLVWTHGGSTHTISSRPALERAIHYILQGQGEPMELYSASPTRGTPP